MVSKKDNGSKKDWRNHGNNYSQIKVECTRSLEDPGNVHHNMGKVPIVLQLVTKGSEAQSNCTRLSRLARVRTIDILNFLFDNYKSDTEEKQDAGKYIKGSLSARSRSGRGHGKMFQPEGNQQDQLGSEINKNILAKIIMEDMVNSIGLVRMIDEENFTKEFREGITVKFQGAVCHNLYVLDDRVHIAVDNIETESSGKEVTDVGDEDHNIRTVNNFLTAVDNINKEFGDDESTNVGDEGYPDIRTVKDCVIATEDNSKKESGDEEAVNVGDEVSPNTCSVEDSVTAAVDGVEPASSLQASVKEIQYDLPKHQRLYKLRKKKEGTTTTRKTEPLKRSQSYSSGDDDYANFFQQC